MKNVVSLALGSLFLLLNSAAFRAFPPTKRSSTSTRPASSVSRQTASLQSRHRRRRKPVARWSPWHVSSFGDPASSDNPLGEDQLVRAAAIEALGNFNGSVVVVDPNSGRILS